MIINIYVNQILYLWKYVMVTTWDVLVNATW